MRQIELNRILGLAAIAIVLALGGWYALAQPGQAAPYPTATPTASPAPTAGITATSTQAPATQVVAIRALANGQYDKKEVTVKAGVPVQLEFSADPKAGCGTQLVIGEFGVRLTSRNGETKTASFTPTAPGDYTYHCGMYMWTGTLHVV